MNRDRFIFTSLKPWRKIKGTKLARLTAPVFFYYRSRYLIIAPVGMIFDGASIPRWCRWLIGQPLHGRYVLPAIIHDSGYGRKAYIIDLSKLTEDSGERMYKMSPETACRMFRMGFKDIERGYVRKGKLFFDRAFLAGMRAKKVLRVKRFSMFSAVALFGFVPWLKQSVKGYE